MWLNQFAYYLTIYSFVMNLIMLSTLKFVPGCCYEIYVRAVTREEARKALKSK
ncbi:hypothetical protein HanIR_Chr09g0442291 [Helianthus annuus]|nr:hypothetical protein HanIR_Chr09g0442291 [Helianthus annuus]